MKKTILLILCAVLISAVLAGCSNTAGSDSKATGDSAVTEAATSALSTFTVETDYATLRLPEKYGDAVQAEVSGDLVTLSSGDTKLMNLHFNSDKGTLLGTIQTDKGEVTVSFAAYDVDPDSDYVAMQDDCLNEILNGLREEYGYKSV